MSLIKNIDFANTLASQGVTVSGEITAVRVAGGPAGNYLQVTPSTGTAGSGHVHYYDHGNINLDPGETIFYSAYIRGPICYLCWPLGHGGLDWYYLQHHTGGNRRLDWNSESGHQQIESGNQDTWHHVVIQFTRASASGQNGQAGLWIDGYQIDLVTTLNYPIYSLGRLRSVSISGSGKYGSFDIADIRVGTTLADVEPYCPAPQTEYPEGPRILIVYRDGDSDSRSLGEYAAGKFGAAWAQLCPVPCSSNETVSDLETFQIEVENPIEQFLTERPTVANQVTVILLGLGVPGYYDVIGKSYSATARLSNMGFLRNGITGNPLAGTTNRITRTTLGAGRYMCVRIDSDSLVNAQAILDATGSAICIDNSTDSAESLRTGSSDCLTALIAGNMAAIGMSDSPDANEQIDPEAFYAMLQAGGTFAEAAYVASSHLDGKIVAAGSPLLMLAGQAGRYFYIGPGSPNQIDWQSPIGWAPSGSSSAKIHASLTADQKYAIGVRSTSAAGTQEHNTHVVCFTEIDSGDNLQPAPLSRPLEITSDRIASELVRIGFTCEILIGYSTPTSFEIFSDSGSGTIDMGTPLKTITNIETGQTDFVVDVSATTFPCQFVVRSKLNAQISPVSNIAYVLANRQPTQPSVL